MNTETKEPVIRMISEKEIKDSMADAKCYEAMPEFLPLRMRLKAQHNDLITPHGCTNCAKNAAYRSAGPAYMQTLARIAEDPEAVARIRAYFKADELRATTIDPVTRANKTIKL